jgi:hypothetical protein
VSVLKPRKIPSVESSTVLKDPAPAPLHKRSRKEVRISLLCPVAKFSSTPIVNRAAVIEANPKLLKHKIAAAEQAAKLQLKQLETSTDHHHEVIPLTDVLTALKILAETNWAE